MTRARAIAVKSFVVGFTLTMLVLWPLLLGCSVVPVYAPTLAPGVEAGIDVGMPIQLGDEGAPLIVKERDTLKFGGHAYDTNGCKRYAYVKSAWAPESKASITAHEIGHMLGLAHVDDPHNIMHPEAPVKHGPLTAGQRRTAKRNAALLQVCEVAE